MENAYAQALWNMVEGGPGREGMAPSKAVHALKALLERQGRIELMPRVGRAFARLAEREAKKSDIVLTVAREKDERHARAKAKEVLATLMMDAEGIKTQVDDTLVGGWRLEGRSVLVDQSYKSRLLEIYNRVTR